MSSWVCLSHPLGPETPAYGGGEGFLGQPVRSFGAGDTCNTSRWNFPNHLGTHVDLPRHFFEEGPALADYPAAFWMFEAVHLLDRAPVSPGAVVDATSLRLDEVPDAVELLLVKTGFESHRGRPQYWQQGPVFSPELARALRSRLPRLRALGFDALSLSSWSDRTTGREAHRAFLAPPRPLLPIEDMSLAPLAPAARIRRAVVAPLWVGDADGAPCTVFAEIEES